MHFFLTLFFLISLMAPVYSAGEVTIPNIYRPESITVNENYI